MLSWAKNCLLFYFVISISPYFPRNGVSGTGFAIEYVRDSDGKGKNIIAECSDFKIPLCSISFVQSLNPESCSYWVYVYWVYVS